MIIILIPADRYFVSESSRKFVYCAKISFRSEMLFINVIDLSSRLGNTVFVLAIHPLAARLANRAITFHTGRGQEEMSEKRGL